VVCQDAQSAPRRPALSTLRADLILLHPPAVHDFRDRGDVYFPFLGTSGDVPITPLYEFFPLGFKRLQRHLGDRGRSVRILNLGTLLLRYPRLELADVLGALDTRLLGIDLHWLVHAQGSLAVAEEAKRLRPDLPLVLGGISATYYAEELIRYPQVDLVMRGYDTLEPTAMLLDALEAGGRGALRAVPNLLWKTRAGEVVDNGLTHAPRALGCGIDWSAVPEARRGSLVSLREITSTYTAGCAFGCGYCGGSRDAFRRVYGTPHAFALNAAEQVAYELGSMRREQGVDRYHLYAMGLDTLGTERTSALLSGLALAGAKSINFEHFHLPGEEVLRRMVRTSERTLITLSPDSHDPAVARAIGRGAYGNEELEAWLERAFALGVEKVDLWYFVGMPEQDERSVQGTVDYCRLLLQRFRGRADPMICPLLPNLDPASRFFEAPEAHGYRVFHRTLEDHRRAALRPSPVQRINYETRWLPRGEIFRLGYRAIRDVLEAKAEVGMFPASRVAQFNARLDDATAFTALVDEADVLADRRDRQRALAELAPGIRERNAEVLSSGVIDQTWPIRRQIGGRWCDELGWSGAELDGLAAGGGPAAAAQG